MDLTYKPFIRDSIISDITVDIPISDITPYRPKYNTDNQSSAEDEEEEATPVQSQVEEVNTATQQNPTPTSTTRSSYKSKFSSKEDFKNTMLPIYESILVQKGLNPLFAKALVAQDALESAWGTKESGKYNFGGIKGKGTVRRTREVVNGQNVYINDSFRDFNSLEDYANYKVNLLNNNRYKAFSGDISEFASRVHRGGYATDPNYSKILNQVIASVKHGGKFQEGGIIEGKEWLKDWYRNRKSLIKQNIKQNQIIPFPVTESLAYNLMAKNIDLTSASINPSKLPDNADGLYTRNGRRMYLRTDSPSVAVHEWTHSSRPDAQIKEIDKVKDTLGDSIYDQKSVIPDNYLDSSNEIYARLMQLRHALNIDPNHKFTNEEIEALKNRFVTTQSLTTLHKDKDENKDVSVTVFDKNNKVIRTYPVKPDFKPVPGESLVTINYDTDKTYDILNRYSTNFIKTLLNDIAKDTNNKKLPLYVQAGTKLKSPKAVGEVSSQETIKWMQDKNGEASYARRHKHNYPEFWGRLTQLNKESIPDWEDQRSYATHKLSWGTSEDKAIVYPEVQKINGKLVDFSRPPYHQFAGMDNALETGNYVEAPSEDVADNFTRTYKQNYKGFPDHDIFKNKISRDVYHTKGDKINYVYNKLLASGYNKIQASAILGSLFIEGQLDENKKEVGGDGYGLMQWTDVTRKNNLKNFKSPTAKNEFERQIDFLMQELKDPNVWLGQRHLDTFLNAKTIDNATEILAKRFCRPAKGKENMDKRKEVARFYVNQSPEYHLTKKYIDLQ